MQIKTITPYKPAFHYEDKEHTKKDKVKFRIYWKNHWTR